MKSDRSTRRRTSLSGPFTARVKRRRRSRRAPWAAAALASILAAPVAAQPQIGSSSSASIGISVSVAPSFGLMPDGPGARDESGYCLATNGEQMTLPVQLVETSSSEQEAEAIKTLAWCDDTRAERRGDVAKPKRAGIIIIIRPE